MTFIVKSSALQKQQPDAQEEWREYQPGVKFLIRGIAHRYVQIGLQAKREKQREVFSRLNSGDLSALRQGKTESEIGIEMLGELVVAGWEGVALESGEDLPYSPETATAILSSPDHQDLTVWALAEAAKISQEAAKRAESRLGKPSPATDGKSSETD
ncbi:hypothetical protein ACMSSJ_11220 [Kerstersia gyiorum]|uniref:hypothetical protein n=1 Tax=Kerstersia gyiorum TaxID=206506 RepID=UPI0039E73EC6